MDKKVQRKQLAKGKRTTVVNIKDHRKHLEDDVFIGRPSLWGNPFKIGIDGTREEVIEKHAKWIKEQPELMAAIPELKGKRLKCFCKPLACHGDTLARMANAAK